MVEQYLELGYQIITALCFICTGATIIAKWTETKKDDEVIAKIHSFLKSIADLQKPKK